MANSSRYRVQLRRRREQKTDFQARKGFVVSGRPRLVARSSLNNTIAQIIVAKPHGDEVLASAHSRELIKKYGWKGATGNIPAAYLTGLLCGLKAKKNGVDAAILDLGLVSPTKGSKVFSTMSGAVDAGVDIPHKEEKIIKERTAGEHIAEYAESLGAPEEYAPKFSKYLANKLSPVNFGDHFETVKAAIFTAYGVAYTPKPKVEKKPKPKAEQKVPAKVAPIKAPAPAPVKVGTPVAAAKVEAKPKAPAKVEPEVEAPAKKAEKPARAEKGEKVEKAEKAEAKPVKAKAAKSEAKEAKEEGSKAKGKAEEKSAKGKGDAKAKPAKKSGGKKE